MDIDLREDPEGELWDYDDDPEPDPKKRARFLIIPLTPPISAQAWKDATPKPVHVNGRYRRQVETATPDVGLYQQAVFRLCCKGWENLKEPDPPKGTGAPIPYNEDTLMLMSRRHSGAVSFVGDIAEMRGRMTEERIREERARFRGISEVPGGPSDTIVRDMPEDV